MMKKGSFDDWIVFSALSLGIIWVILYIFLSRSSEKIKKDVDANDSSFSRYVDHSSIISSHDLLRQRQFHGNNNTQVLDHNILPRPIPQRPNFHSPPLVETPRIPVHQHFNEDDGNPIIPTTKNSRVTNEDKSFVSTKPFVGLRGSAALVTVNRLELLLQEANAQSTSQCLNHDDSSQNIKQSVSDHTTGVLHSLPNVSLTDLSLISVLGGGAFGQVWKGSWRGTPVAVKILHPALSSNSPITSSFQEEISLLSRLRHPNICLCLAASTDSSSPAIVTELATNGNLWEALRNPNAVPLYLCESSKRFHWPEKAIIKVIEGMCRGLVYLHLEGIVHRDLKSANLLLDEGFNVKICDFGLARLKDMAVAMTANVGTIQWMAPEVLSGQTYSEKADIYSVGIIIWEILTGKCPFEGMNAIEIAMTVVQKHGRPPIPSQCTSYQSHFLELCWNQQAEKRLESWEILNKFESSFFV